MVGDKVDADAPGAEKIGIKGILVRCIDGRAAHSSMDLAGVARIVECDPSSYGASEHLLQAREQS